MYIYIYIYTHIYIHIRHGLGLQPVIATVQFTNIFDNEQNYDDIGTIPKIYMLNNSISFLNASMHSFKVS